MYPLLLRTRVTCAFSSVVPALVKGTERRVDIVSQSHWPHLPIQPGFSSGLSPFSSGLAGSLSSSLHENYSMGELKECGVHSVEQLTERYIHSLATQRVQEAHAREVKGQQRLASNNMYEHSCIFIICHSQTILNPWLRWILETVV